MITPPKPPPFKSDAALYFLDAGHYLLRYGDRDGIRSKFISALDVAAAFSGSDQDTGWLPPGIVRAGYSPKGEWYVYSAPAQVLTVQVEGNDLTTITIPIPRTVLLAIGNTFYMWALAGENFAPGENAYRAPFPNVHTDGIICWGSNKPPKSKPDLARKAWDLFFGTPFNAHLSGQKSKAYPEDIRTLLRQLDREKAEEYPVGELVATGQTIGDLVSRILKR